MQEPQINEQQQLQNQYSQLCGQRGHLQSQILVAEDQIEDHKQGLDRNLVELKSVIKKIGELNRKIQFDAQKAAEAEKAAALPETKAAHA